MLPSPMRETINHNTMKYTEKITLEQALDLQNKIKAGEMPDIQVYSFNASGLNIVNLNGLNIGQVYLDHNYLLLTRPDYATYIQRNKPLPYGYGYPSKELSSGIYDGLRCVSNWKTGDWYETTFLKYVERISGEWHEWGFSLTDLARVEAEAKPERTEINAAQVCWLFGNEPETEHWLNGTPYSDFMQTDTLSSEDVYHILTTTYNSLPDEFKALADHKPSMPANFTYQNDEWLREANKLAVKHEELKAKYEAQASEIAKYLEMGTENASLKLQLQEATALADAKQDKIHELEAQLEKQRIDINNYCRAADKANEQAGEFWQLLLRTQELNQQYQIALTHLI